MSGPYCSCFLLATVATGDMEHQGGWDTGDRWGTMVDGESILMLPLWAAFLFRGVHWPVAYQRIESVTFTQGRNMFTGANEVRPSAS